MRILIIGGTGTISTAITRQLLDKGGVDIVHFNRGNRETPAGVRTIVGDRRDFTAFEERMKVEGEFDCVIDMIGFQPDEAESAVRAFKGRAGHYIYCSTVDVYSKTAAYYPIDEAHPRHARPSFPYAYNKANSENVLMDAHGDDFPVTIFRPAQTYGGIGFAVASVGDGVYQMKRLRQGRPIIVHGDGTSIWTACHRDDVAAAFVRAIGLTAAFGQSYNVTGEEWMTYDRYWLTVAEALKAPVPRIVHIPTDLLGRMLPKRAEWCVENFRYNNIFDNTAAKRDLGFRYSVKWADGIADVVRQLDASGLIDNAEEAVWYDRVVEEWESRSAAMAERIRPYDSP